MGKIKNALKSVSGKVLPSNREHVIFLFIVFLTAFVVLILGVFDFEFLNGFFHAPSPEVCEDLSGYTYDDTFTCPNPVAQMRFVCVDNWAQCPKQFSCSNSTQQPCWDGTCVDIGTCPEGDPYATNICVCGVPCVVKNMTDEEFASETVNVNFVDPATCATSSNFNYFNQPYYWFFIIWMVVLPSTMFIWCAVNQRVLGRNCKPSVVRGADAELVALQTGYKFSWPGYILYWLVLLTIFYIHLCMLLLTVQFYNINLGYEGLWGFDQPDDRRSLFAFQIVWEVGVIYMFVILWPDDLKSYFMVRTKLSKADFVRVWAAAPEELLTTDYQVSRLFNLWGKLEYGWNVFFGFLYSDVTFNHNRGSWSTCKVSITHEDRRVLTCNLSVLVYDFAANAFVPFPRKIPDTVSQLIAQGKEGGISEKDSADIRENSGPNKIDVPKPEVFATLVEQFSRPFYTYQAFMAWTYFNFSFWHMGIMNTLVYSLSGLTIARISYVNRNMLYKLVSGPNSVQVKVKRNGIFVKVSAVDIVPGDVIAVEKGLCVADLVLVEGTAVVDESALTGEAMPVHKVSLDPTQNDMQYNKVDHKKSTLRSGTTVLQGAVWDDSYQSPSTVGIVLYTGSNTLKGRDVVDILLKPPPLFKFDVQVKFVVLILLAYAIVMFSLTLHFLGEDPVYAWFYGMYVVATSLPPLLPSVFVVSVSLGATRLKNRGVICSNPDRLLAAGKVKLCCFDKTGTLTESSMAMHGVCLSQNQVEDDCKSKSNVSLAGGKQVKIGEQFPYAPEGSLMEVAMASCHGLSKLGDQIIGTMVDVIMFKSTKWSLEQNGSIDVVRAGNGSRAFQVLRRFDFDHHRMTSSVIAKDMFTGEHFIFVKGSAESIQRYLAVPNNELIPFADEQSCKGDYTLAIASRNCTLEEAEKYSTTPRDQIETNLVLTGLFMLRNELKSDSSQAITLLKDGGCKTVMLTGDNILTAIFIAKKVGMISPDTHVLRSKSIGLDNSIGSISWVDENMQPLSNSLESYMQKNSNVVLAILGEVWQQLSREDQLMLLPKTNIWARANPTNKLDVVNMYVSCGFVTSMCGDGANDCGALRAAHIGIALSDSDASVVSPFTSIKKTVMSNVDVLLEGRASLASAFACYMYMLMYGQIETMNQVINAWYSITFGEWNWVFMDGLWIVSLSYSLAYANPSKRLKPSRPTSSLLGCYTIASVVGLLAICFIFLAIALAILNTQEWYQCRKWDPASANLASLATIGDNYEATVIFIVTGAQYIGSAMAFNFGHKYRQPWLYNWRLAIFLAVFIGIHVTIIFYPSRLSCLFRVNCSNEWTVRSALSTCPNPVSNPWKTTVMPISFRIVLFAIVVLNTICAMCWTKFVISGPFGDFIVKWYKFIVAKYSKNNNKKDESFEGRNCNLNTVGSNSNNVQQVQSSESMYTSRDLKTNERKNLSNNTSSLLVKNSDEDSDVLDASMRSV